MAEYGFTIEVSGEIRLSDDVDWEQRARDNGYDSVEDMVGNLAYWVCIDNLDCPHLDGYVDLPADAVVDAGTDVTDRTVWKS